MAIVGAALSAFGTVFGMIGQMKEAKAMEKAEKVRENQMRLESNRRKRETLRQAAVARAEAISNAYNQGAGESSALAGGLATTTATAARNVQATTQDESSGRQIFGLNRDRARAQGMQAIGSGISSLGGIVSGNAGTFNRLING